MGIDQVRVVTDDQVGLHVEVTGRGSPILFIHEFAGDHRSWEPQVRYFSRRHRCVTFSARGYPPSEVPEDPAAYSQERAVADAVAVIDALDIRKAHTVGLSMGGFAALHLARTRPDRVLSATIAGVGYGSAYERRPAFQTECEIIARAFEEEGAEQVSKRYALGPARVQFAAKDPQGHAEFQEMLAQHSDIGSANTMRGFQRLRPSLYDFVEEFERMDVPVLVMVGDEDDGAIEGSLMLKRTIPTAGLAVFPKTGHTLNLEEPALFNVLVEQFIATVSEGAWDPRDPRSLAESTTGMNEPPAE
jgi:pimeloyl-ACP methyl ester carboxylesterase